MDQMILEVKNLFRNYFVFTGRQSRRSFWYAYFGIMLCSFLVSILSTITGIPFLGSLFSLFTFIPILAAEVRRFHDIGKSTALCIFFYVLTFITSFVGIITLFMSFFVFTIDNEAALGGSVLGLGIIFCIISLIGSIVFLVFLATKGDPEENQYGPVPGMTQE